MSQEDGTLLSILFKICLLNDMYIKITSFKFMLLFTHYHKPDFISIGNIKLKDRINQDITDFLCVIYLMPNLFNDICFDCLLFAR